jgi:hypothetical protein
VGHKPHQKCGCEAGYCMSDTTLFDQRSSRTGGLDGRTFAARRISELAQTYTAALGGTDAVDAMQREMVLKAAQLTVAAEEMRRRSLKGEAVDVASLVKLENLAGRAVKALNLNGKRKPPVQDLQSYLASKAAGRAA